MSTTIGQNVQMSADTQLGTNVHIGHNVTFYPGVIVEDDVTIFDGAVLGRPPKSAGNTTRPLSQTLTPLRIGKGSIIGANAVLYGGSTLGAHVLIGDLASLREGCQIADEVVLGRGVLVMYETQVGARTRVIDGAILTGNMIIEEDVFIGPGVNSVNDNDVYLKRYGLESFSVGGPIVRRFALVGTAANLAAGIEIGVGAIVAPSAMVTHNVEPWSVVAGVPARVLRTVNPDDRRRILDHFALPSNFGAEQL